VHLYFERYAEEDTFGIKDAIYVYPTEYEIKTVGYPTTDSGFLNTGYPDNPIWQKY
jgi:hypothetical protein